MQPTPITPATTRLGFHYFPDTVHYRESDLSAWAPELHSLGASWLTLVAPLERAIPEAFIKGLLAEGIQPILHFQLPLEASHQRNVLKLLFRAYARWGIRYVALFERPNLRTAWTPAAWAQSELVERFLDLYLPLAEMQLSEGLIPVFPPLEPGGDYWDTAFLRASLRGMQRRGCNRLLDSLALGAYAWAGNRPLDWGAGGPERWPGARPYLTPQGMQDQRGFRIFDWYLTLSEAELGNSRPVLLLKAGSRLGDRGDANHPAIDAAAHTRRNLAIAQLMAVREQETREDTRIDPEVPDPEGPGLLEPVSSQVLACNLWLLSASAGSPHAAQAWFQPDGSSLPVAGELRNRTDKKVIRPVSAVNKTILMPELADDAARRLEHPWVGVPDPASGSHPIAHYLLLPLYEWGVPDWYLDGLRPFIKQYHPTTGFSPEEARLAARVTVVGGVQAYPEEVLDNLRSAGCMVERMIGDGTLIAS